MHKIVAGAILAVLILAAYLSLWPVPIRAVSWEAPAAPGYVGMHAINNKLQGRQLVALPGEVGPEHVVLGPDGKLYAGVASGRILRLYPDASGLEVFASTGGRPLGLAFDGHGKLIAADAIKGLLSIAADGKVTVLADRVGNDPIRFANAVAVARDGKIF